VKGARWAALGSRCALTCKAPGARSLVAGVWCAPGGQGISHALLAPNAAARLPGESL